MSVLSQLRNHLRQSVATYIVIIICMVVIGALQLPQLENLRNRSQNLSPQALKKEVESEKLRLNLLKKMPAFGFDNLLADWVFLGFLQYFGDDDAREFTGYQIAPDYFEIVLDRDPRFRDAYYFLSTSSSLYAGLPERSVALMNQGLKSLSPQVPFKSYYIWRYKGIDELLFLGDGQAAKKSFEMSAEWASIYADPESQTAVVLSRKTADFLAKNPKSKSAQVSAWAMVLTNTKDQRTRQIAISRIEAIGGKVLITPEGAVRIQSPPKD